MKQFMITCNVFLNGKLLYVRQEEVWADSQEAAVWAFRNMYMDADFELKNVKANEITFAH